MLDEYFKFLKRSALVIIPKEPFLAWLKFHDPEEEFEPSITEGDIYLLPAFETKEQIENWLRKNFNFLFTEQLNNWYTDPEMWPQNRTFKMFREWFNYSAHTWV